MPLRRLFVPAALAALAASPAALHAASADSVPAETPPAALVSFDAASAAGHSGRLRVVIADADQPLELPLEWATAPTPDVRYRWAPQAGTPRPRLLGDARLADGLRAPAGAGIWRLELTGGGWTEELDGLTVVTRVPFEEKSGGYLNGYRIGRYPTEGTGREDRYAPPSGFIEVTPENRELHVSEHFRLGDFLTKDQFDVWPKYVALDLRLIDKLELVMEELNAMGIRASRMAVMSGFRTPAYNGPGGDGRARLSRHTYGDASDVWVDNDGDGYMDDLNGDGRIDARDATLLGHAADRVERRFPDLIGGVGIYRANAHHGPFVHIDARGNRARW